MDIFNNNQQLEAAVFTGIDYALWVRHNTPAPFLPFILFFKQGNIHEVTTVTGEKPDEMFTLALAQLSEPFEQAVMCVESYEDNGDNNIQNAVLVKGFDNSEPLGALFGQRFTGIESGETFARRGKPVLFSSEVPLPVPLQLRYSNPARVAPFFSTLSVPAEQGGTRRIVFAGHFNASLLANALQKEIATIVEKADKGFSGEILVNLLAGNRPAGDFERFIFSEIQSRLAIHPAVKKWQRQYAKELQVSFAFGVSA